MEEEDLGLRQQLGRGPLAHVCAIRDIEMRHPNPASTGASSARSGSTTTRGQAAICPCDGVAAGDKVGGHDTSA